MIHNYALINILVFQYHDDPFSKALQPKIKKAPKDSPKAKRVCRIVSAHPLTAILYKDITYLTA